MSTDDARTCECDLPRELASIAGSPVILDPTLNEFNLVFDQRSYVMYHCFSCGGRLPESRRGDLFVKPTEPDVVALRQVMDSARTVQDLMTQLGEPDQIMDGSTLRATPLRDVFWSRQLTYSRIWQSLNLHVFELPNGSIQYGFTGKPKEPQPADG